MRLITNPVVSGFREHYRAGAANLPRKSYIAAFLAFLVLAVAIAIWIPEGQPFFGFYISWFLTLAVLYVVIGVPAVGGWIAKTAQELSAYLMSRGAFFSNAAVEMPKFAILRIAFGLFITQRAIYVLYLALPGDFDSFPILAFMISNLVLGLMVSAGFLTQFSLAALILFQWQVGDEVIGTGTLGNNIAAILGTFLVIANAGAHISVDRFLMEGRSRFGKFIGRFYYEGGIPSDSIVNLAKFFALLSYWAVCLYSVAQHISEPAWTSGVAGPQLLASNFMSRLSGDFSIAFAASPIIVFATRLSLWVMIAWYFALLPFVVIGGYFRRAVIYWGFLFICLSIFILELGWLGPFEAVLWAALFWRHAFIRRENKLAVAYDDRCNLCDRTVNFLMTVDLFERLEFKPLTRNEAFLQKYGIDKSAALTDLYGVSDANGDVRKYAGYDLYLELSKRLLVLVPLFPILLVGKYVKVGPLIYSWIAARRVRLFGVCELPSPKPEPAVSSRAKRSTQGVFWRDPGLVFFSHIFVAVIGYVLMIPAPFAHWYGAPIGKQGRVALENFARQALVYGITPIDVFNSIDLRMSENWFTLSAVAADGRETLMPIFNSNGERLSWHNSDRIYFGTTLRWRRSFPTGPDCRFDRSIPMLKRFAGLYTRLTGEHPARYVYRQYHSPLADSGKILLGHYIQEPPKLFCEGTLPGQP